MHSPGTDRSALAGMNENLIMLFSLLPFGCFRPASWKIFFIVWAAALIVASMFYYLIIYAASF